MAEESKPSHRSVRLTINDLPTEIIEMFAPDLRPQTVSNLRLVSKRFRDVFSADRYIRAYLWYADRLDMYDGMLEEIGKENRWRRCLEAEKRQMNNWKRGQTERVDKVQVPSNLSPAGDQSVFFWEGAIGEKNEFWMMSEVESQKVILANLTGDPILVVIDVSSYTDRLSGFAHIFPDQVVIESDAGIQRVFNILSNGKNLSLEFAYTFQTTGYPVSISGRSILSGKFTSLLISDKHPTIWTVRDLKKGVLLEDIVLKNLSPPNLQKDLNNMSFVSFCDSKFPYVSAFLEVIDTDKRLFLVLDVDKRRIAYYYWNSRPFNITFEEVKGNTLLLHLCDFQNSKYMISVYDLRKHPNRDSEGDKFHVLFQSDVTDSHISSAYEPPMLITHHVEKGQVVCTHIGDPDNIRSEFSLQDMGITLHFCVGPYFVSVDDQFLRLWTWDRFGNPMFDWTEMLTKKTGNVLSLRAASDLHWMDTQFEINKLAKCIVVNEEGDNLFICYF